MRYRMLAVAVLVVVALVASVRAADLAGTWTAKFVTQVGDQDYTFTFTSSGGQIAGTAKSTLLGDTKLTDIKLEGDKVTFVENVTFQDMPLRITYTGAFSSADEIKFTRVVVEGTPEEAVAKRSK
jgi:hypothetical protein